MKITKDLLKQIIKEELEIYNEGAPLDKKYVQEVLEVANKLEYIAPYFPKNKKRIESFSRYLKLLLNLDKKGIN